MTAGAAGLDDRIAGLLPKGGVFVDLGCGGGEALDALCGSYSLAIGIDRSTTRLGRRGDEPAGWKFVQGDLNTTLPLPSNYANAILANQVIEHVLDPLHFLSEANRILSPNGVIVVTTPNVRYVRQLVRLVVKGQGPRAMYRQRLLDRRRLG